MAITISFASKSESILGESSEIPAITKGCLGAKINPASLSLSIN